MDLERKVVLVVGLGASGRAAARLLAARGAKVILNDARTAEALPDAVALAGEIDAGLELGGHDPELFTSVDRIVLSPGVPRLPAIDAADAAGIPVSSEIELASAFVEGRILGITGTNGKSTVTSMVGAICEAAGLPTFVGGNLGAPLAGVVGTEAASPRGVMVVELSSFQLERVSSFRAHVAAVLNVTPDHLDRYPSVDAYAAAKGRIFEGQRKGDVAIVPDGDEACLALARPSAATIRTFGGHGDVQVIDGRIVDMAGRVDLPIAELGVAGGHNVPNACAATLIARSAGVPAVAIEKALRAFRGLPHRMVKVGELDGVAYYDDSKATNVGAAVAALDGLADRPGKVVLIAGGKDKGGSYAPLRERMEATGRALVLIGEAAPLIADAMAGSTLGLANATSMEEAVREARALARPGDIVLLAPACSSFDMFDSYAHRGEVFEAAVRALGGGGRR
jgi:UDP-N-acetylmuramoylalanine--D-glutamate ligase